MSKLSYLFSLIFLVVFSAHAQDTIPAQNSLKKKTKPSKKEQERTVINGDTLAVYNLPVVSIGGERTFKTKKEEKKYWRMVRNVKKALPYAKIAREKLDKYEAQLDGKSKGERKRIMKQVEQELLAEYETELRGFTLTQGRILLKLIDRETGHTSYDLVESLRGWFSANFWQGIAVLFDADMKSEFNPKDNADDAMIDEIVVRIENGEL
ncbi:MAG: DUF4294 domain-containing protein [Bacteroidia bacterium]